MQDKVSIVQIMGSWCPNCMDEIRYMTAFGRLAHPDLRLVGITFERKRMEEGPAIERMIRDLAIDYPLLYGGEPTHSRQPAADCSFDLSPPPFSSIGRAGAPHTPVSGPGTSAYAAYAEETRSVSDLLSE